MSEAGSRIIDHDTLNLFHYDITFKSGLAPLSIVLPLPLADMIWMTRTDDDADMVIPITSRVAAWNRLSEDYQYVLKSMQNTMHFVGQSSWQYGPQVINLDQIAMALPRTSAGTASDRAYTVLGTRDAELDINFVGAAVLVQDVQGKSWFIPVPGPVDDRTPIYNTVKNMGLIDIQGVLICSDNIQQLTILNANPDAWRQGIAAFWNTHE